VIMCGRMNCGMSLAQYTTGWRRRLDTPVIEIERVRHCDRCQSEQQCKLVRNITASGISQVYWLCLECNNNIRRAGSKGGLFLSHMSVREAHIDIESLPVINDYRDGGTPCAVCGAPGTEYHHWAPRHLFEDADSWPTAYLCREHHSYWHNRVTPNMSKR
jgi:hypothetical protein